MNNLFIDSNNIYTNLISDIKIIPKKKEKKFNFFVILLILSTLSFGTYEFLKFREKKKLKEIENIKSKAEKAKFNNNESCKTYSLRTRKNGYYPCYNCVNMDSIFLFSNEVWKYGKTCIGEDKRYTNLEELNLRFYTEFIGTEKECLIREKELIYSYPTLLECLKRDFYLIRPPGNKIDR